MNPFKSALFATFVKERDYAVKVTNDGSTCENEQLVWVLWKILKGDGNDVSGHLIRSYLTVLMLYRLVRILPVPWHGHRCRPNLEQLI